MSILLGLVALSPACLIVLSCLPQAAATPRGLSGGGQAACLGALGTGLALALAVFSGGPLHTATLGFAGIGFALYVDALTIVMFCLVSFVGVTVLRYSSNYLAGDPRHGVFIQRMCATIACVQVLVTAGNLALLMLAWIATSVCLNRLLLFYSDRRAAVIAARKKFVASRLGDLCLAGAAACLYVQFGSLDYSSLFAGAAGWQGAPTSMLTGAALCIAGAALFKSAQFPFHGWLLEVMETPTPVSALLHAGIINAGGFLVLRLAEIFSLVTPAMHVLAGVGALTALFGSMVMLTQTSVKVSLAYSTIAQMGFMLLQCGLGAYAAATLHILAHSLYKAHAFLSSGSVVDVLRASWSPRASAQPHPWRFLLALVLTLAGSLATGWVFGATLADKPGVFVLGAVLVMGLTLYIANAIDERPDAYVIARTGVLALGVGSIYFALQAGAESLLAGALPSTQPTKTPAEAVFVILVVAAFAVVAWLQGQMGAIAKTRWGKALYIHLSHGLYVNTLANRLVIQMWGRRASGERASRGVAS